MPERATDITQVIDHSPFSRFQVRIVVLCVGLAVLDGFDTQALGFAIPAMAKAWQISAASFTFAATIGLAGTIVGSILAGAVGDRFGRRRVILVSIAVFSLGTLATVALSSMGPLVVLRFVTSLGIGGLLPNLIAVVSEYSPRRHRLLTVTFAVTGIGLGGALGGVVSAWLIPVFGWHGLFVAGGVAGLLAGAAAFLGVPESIRVLAQSGDQRRVQALLSRITRTAAAPEQQFTVAEETTTKASVAELFRGNRAAATVLLWLIFAMNLLMLYFMLSWLPTLLGQAGLGSSAALVGTSVYNLGGVVGGVVLGLRADRVRRPYFLLGTTYLAAVVLISVLPLVRGSLTGLFVIIAAAGFCVVGAQPALSALTAAVYPTTVRATGMGWAFGVGRIASILGPALGGLFLASGLGAITIISLMAVPAALAAAGSFWLGIRRTSRTGAGPHRAGGVHMPASASSKSSRSTPSSPRTQK